MNYDMKRYERHGPGKWYMDDRQEQRKEILDREKEYNDEALKRMEKLEVKIRLLKEKRQGLEDVVEE